MDRQLGWKAAKAHPRGPIRVPDLPTVEPLKGQEIEDMMKERD